MVAMRRLSATELIRRCEEEAFTFETTAELQALGGAMGQARAEEALDFGISVSAPGYNLFALGPPGLGKHAFIEKRLKGAAKKSGKELFDWCYVHNFEEPLKPRVLKLGAGRGRELQSAMRELVQALKEEIPAALGGEDYQTSQQAIDEGFRRHQDEALELVREEARKYDIAVIRTPSGVVMAPMENDEVVGPMEFQERSAEERDAFEKRLKELHQKLESSMSSLPRWERERRRASEALEQETVGAVVRDLLGPVRETFSKMEEVQEFLGEVEKDLIENRQGFLSEFDDEFGARGMMPFLGGEPAEADVVERYGVNVLVEHRPGEAAPVVREHHPTLENLIGRVDHRAHFGALSTDYSLIRPGALHKANGGYLIVDALDVLRYPLGWEQLKRMIRSKEVRIESPGQILNVLSTITMEPEPIPLDIKIVMVGSRELFELLHKLDPDVDELFKVVVDFEDDGLRENREGRFARLLAGLIEDGDLRPFHRGAVAKMLEEASRFAGDSRRITLKVEMLRDLLSEADHFAAARGAEFVERKDVLQAVDARRRRRGRLQERRLESIVDGELVVATRGAVVGQINGLSIAEQGGYRFGMPSRITASVRLGRGEVVDIEREVEMSGPIHSKGVLILSGYLGTTFGDQRPLSLHASLVFEQTYWGVDGDSASLGETLALLSALAQAEVRQDLAVTGSIDQQGNVQAVGGINEKIEGFFDTCRRLGMTGKQGVLIPAANVEHLMLRPDVVEAVEAGQFHVYAVERVEEAAQLLMEMAPGERDKAGEYEPETLYGRVAARLEDFARAARRWDGGARSP